MASLCCLPRRARIQLPEDESHSSPPSRYTRLIECKGPLSPPPSIASPIRRTRVLPISADTSASTHLLSEKDNTLVVEAEVEQDDEDDDAASHTSTTVSCGTRITSLTSTYTGQSRMSRASDEDVISPPSYRSESRGELPGFVPASVVYRAEHNGLDSRTAGDLYRDIQRTLARSENRFEGSQAIAVEDHVSGPVRRPAFGDLLPF